MTDVQKQALNSDDKIDKVLFSQDTQITTGGVGWGDLGNDVLPLGIYQISGVWYDFTQVVVFSGITIQPSTKTDIHANPNGVFFDSSVHAKFVVLALSDGTYNRDDFYQEKASFVTSEEAYMKIYLDGSFTRSASAPEMRTIAHNLGYIPMINVWIKDNGYVTRLSGNLGSGSTGTAVLIDETNLYISTMNTTPTRDITVYYRVYLERQTI